MTCFNRARLVPGTASRCAPQDAAINKVGPISRSKSSLSKKKPTWDTQIATQTENRTHDPDWKPELTTRIDRLTHGSERDPTYNPKKKHSVPEWSKLKLIRKSELIRTGTEYPHFQRQLRFIERRNSTPFKEIKLNCKNIVISEETSG